MAYTNKPKFPQRRLREVLFRLYPPWAYILHIPGTEASNCFRCTHICISCRAGISNSVDIRTAGPYTTCHCNARSFHNTPLSFELLTKPTDITYTMENKKYRESIFPFFQGGSTRMFLLCPVSREKMVGAGHCPSERGHRCTARV